MEESCFPRDWGSNVSDLEAVCPRFLALILIDVAMLALYSGRWPNVYTNLKNIDYCTDQFNYIT